MQVRQSRDFVSRLNLLCDQACHMACMTLQCVCMHLHDISQIICSPSGTWHSHRMQPNYLNSVTASTTLPDMTTSSSWSPVSVSLSSAMIGVGRALSVQQRGPHHLRNLILSITRHNRAGAKMHPCHTSWDVKKLS